MEQTQRVAHSSTKEFLSRALSTYQLHAFSFALWRLPDSPVVCLAGSDNPQAWEEVILEETDPGFLFSPFDPSGKKIYLPADDLLKFEPGTPVSATGSRLEDLLAKSPAEANRQPIYYSSGTRPATSSTENNFI